MLDEARKIPSVQWIYFEGGEPFLYYPILIEGSRIAKEMGFKTGLVTNAYWATTEGDARPSVTVVPGIALWSGRRRVRHGAVTSQRSPRAGE
ncbi:MAG: hypothetical protein AB1486_34935 [Planctomycetota bacterium]